MSHSPRTLRFTLNGRPQEKTVATNRILADLIREDCTLTGTKVSCDQNACGACTVLVDGEPHAACSTFAFEIDGRALTTVEGLADDEGIGRVLREAFDEHGAFQCGFCTGGLLAAATAVLRQREPLERADIRRALNGNWCRCTGYQVIVDAVHAANERLLAGEQP